MRARLSRRTLVLLIAASVIVPLHAQAPLRSARRIVIFKIDGLNPDLLNACMRQNDPQTGRPLLPWFAHIFSENGAVFENFYVRGISLSAPSWSMLDSGRHAVIRGNVEYDRFTGEIYDYLNFVPFYLGYARLRTVDMPGVKVLDRAGIPLLIDRFRYEQVLQSFQLFQRGVSWFTLRKMLERKLSGRSLLGILENGEMAPFSSELTAETEGELEAGLANPNILYLDFFTGAVDHEGHATSSRPAMLAALREQDSRAGRIWTAIQKSPLARQTLFVVVSDHGMNNVPGIISQTFSLPGLLNSPAGGAHHVLTNRQQLSDFKLKGLNPLTERVVTPSPQSFYLKGQSSQYPTAWLDIDGNERAAIHLRNSDLNKIQILLNELARPDSAPHLREAVAGNLKAVLDRHRATWGRTALELEQELAALDQAIAERKKLVETFPKNVTTEEHDTGQDKQFRRSMEELQDWRRERTSYTGYLKHLKALLAFAPDPTARFEGKISDLVPENSLGENNTVGDLQNYVAGPSAAGIVLNATGELDEPASFRHVNYFELMTEQRVRNSPQSSLPPQPIDFSAVRLPDGAYADEAARTVHAYWLYGDAENQLLVLEDHDRLAVRPIRSLKQALDGTLHWAPQTWGPGLPLHLFEDRELQIPSGSTRGDWLCAWHTAREWLDAVHRCRYSNGVIGVAEELSPVGENVPGPAGINPTLLRYERRRRELVQADFHVFAADHWNFNVRFPNPGGNHGSFFRISTHSVWMLAGSGIPAQRIEEPYDSLSFQSTVLSLAGLKPTMPDLVVPLSRPSE